MNFVRRLFLLWILIFCFVLVGCGSTPTSPVQTNLSPPVTLQVFAAASLTESFTEIGQKYHQAHPTTTINFNFAGSQALEQQMANGALADVFASADQDTMQKADKDGLTKAAQIFAQNKLVVIIPADNPGGIATLKDLAKSGIKIDMAASNVPAGKYALQVLDKMAQSPDYSQTYKDAVLHNVVSQEDNVKAVVQKVQLGEADAGFVYLTDVTTAVSQKVTKITIPDPLNVIAQYPIAITKHAAQPQEAQDFVQYILSKDGQDTLASYQFIVAKG